MPLYALLVEDANGHGQLVAVILTRGEGALNIHMMMGRLLENNPKLHETKVFIVDKDFAEIKIVFVLFHIWDHKFIQPILCHRRYTTC